MRRRGGAGALLAPAAASAALPAALGARGIVLQLSPPAALPAPLGNSPEEEQYSFSPVCQTEETNPALV